MIRHVGETPMVLLKAIPQLEGYKCKIYAKLEYLNPTGSATDRLAKIGLQKADRDVLFCKGDVIASRSGDLCVSAAWCASIGDFKSILVPERTTPESKFELMETFGGRVVTPFHTMDENPESNSDDSLKNTVEVLSKTVTNSVTLSPSPTPSSIKTYYETLGAEIKNEIPHVNMLVCGGEAGGMIYGINMKMRDPTSYPASAHLPFFRSIGVDFKYNSFSPSQIGETDNEIPQWTEADFGGEISANQLTLKLVNKWYRVSDTQSYIMARRINREEGLYVGPSCGAVLCTALEAINKCGLKDNSEAVIVCIFNSGYADGYERFMDPQWMMDHRHLHETEMETLFWWWKQSLSCLNLSKFIFHDRVSDNLETLLRLMEEAQVQYAILRGERNKTLGIIQKEFLELNLELEVYKKTDKIDGKYCPTFSKVAINDDFHVLNRELQEVPYVLIVQEETFPDNPINFTINRETILGVVDQCESQQYLKHISRHHLENYGIELTDGIMTEKFLSQNSWSQGVISVNLGARNVLRQK